MSVKILVGDVFEKLASLPDDSVHTVVTSPPYWGLRDYGVEGQIGLEPTLGEHIDVIVRVFDEIKRVLRPDGTVWVNYGDCYATAPNGRSAEDTKAAGNDDRAFRDKPFSTVGPIYAPDYHKGDRRADSDKQKRNTGQNISGAIVAGGTLKAKDLCMIPNRIAIALQDAGWYVRSEIIWAKPNPMPESITDRPGTSHEKLFLLTKSPRYFYDAEAVREPASPASIERWEQDIEGQAGSDRANGGAKTNGPMKSVGGPKKDQGSTPRHEGHIQHTKLDEAPRGYGRNLRNVWSIAIAGFGGEYCRACSTYFIGKGKKDIRIEKIVGDDPDKITVIKHCPCGATDDWLSHFATFPPALVEPCVKAGTSEKGVCPDCGAGWVRETKTEYHKNRPSAGNDPRSRSEDNQAKGSRTGHHGWRGNNLLAEKTTTGWEPGCECTYGDGYPMEPVPATVLDPFGGAGTTALVADRLGRDAVLIELNVDYADMARQRIAKDAGLFGEIE